MKAASPSKFPLWPNGAQPRWEILGDSVQDLPQSYPQECWGFWVLTHPLSTLDTSGLLHKSADGLVAGPGPVCEGVWVVWWHMRTCVSLWFHLQGATGHAFSRRLGSLKNKIWLCHGKWGRKRGTVGRSSGSVVPVQTLGRSNEILWCFNIKLGTWELNPRIRWN